MKSGRRSEPVPVRGVILAAGEGRRIRPMSNVLPKPLLPVLDRPLIVRQIEGMRALGIREVLVVVGHLRQELVDTVGDGEAHDVRLRYVDQHETLGVAHALAQVEPYVDGPFLLFLGDVYFEADDLSLLTAPLGREDVEGVLTVQRADAESIRHNFSVELGREGTVRRVVEKPRNPPGDLKGCGIYAFRPSVFDAIRRTPRTALRNEYELTDAIQILIDGGKKVLAVPAITLDFNLSEPHELLALNLHCLKRAGQERFVAADAELSPGARVDRSVVLSRARVDAEVVLRRCLVMPGEHVRRGTYEDVIFVDGAEVRCG